MSSSAYMIELPKLGVAVPATDLAFSVGIIALLSLLAQWLLKQYRLSQWPVFNKAGFFNASKAKNAFRWSAQKLLVDGFTKSPNGYLIDTDMRRQIVLSPKYANEIRSDSRFDFLVHNHRDFLGHLPGFEVFKAGTYNSEIGVDVVRQKLTQSLGLLTEDISEEMTAVLHEQWTEETDWHEITAKPTILEIVARISSRVFLGPEVCRNPEWLRITIDYTVNVFMAVEAVKRYPRFLHGIVHWFLPEARKVRKQVAEARRIIQPVIDQRAAAGWVHPGHASGKKYTDAVQWMQDMSKGRPYDAAIAQLGLSMAAIHTTTDLLTQVIFDICQHPEIIQPLREEAISVLKTEGWKKTAFYKMKLMDSVIKESQRLKPAGMLMMRRYVTEDVTLQDGQFLPKGSFVGVSTHWSWDPSVYENPDQWDGYRFLRLLEDPEKEKIAHFVSTSPQHLGFGHGKHACPGRFFASNEVKIALTHILLKYDFKLPENANPTVFSIGWMMASDGNTKIQVKRRREEVALV